MKKQLPIILILLLTLTDSIYAQNLIDIKDHWAKSSIEYVEKKEIMTGYGNNLFMPDRKMTNSEFIRVVNSIIGSKETRDIDFLDVEKNSWYYNQYRIAAANNILEKIDRVYPEEYTSRKNVAKIISKVYALSPKGVNVFKDIVNLDKEERDGIVALYEAKIIVGFEDGTFRPKDSLTRAQMASITKNLIETLGYPEDLKNNSTPLEIEKEKLKGAIKSAEEKLINIPDRELERLVSRGKYAYENSTTLQEIIEIYEELVLKIDSNVNNSQGGILNLNIIDEDGNSLNNLNPKITANGMSIRNGDRLNPGNYMVKVSLEGFKENSTLVSISKERKEITIQLARENTNRFRLTLGEYLVADTDEQYLQNSQRVEISVDDPMGRDIKHFLVNGEARLGSGGKYIFKIKEDTTVEVVFK